MHLMYVLVLHASLSSAAVDNTPKTNLCKNTFCLAPSNRSISIHPACSSSVTMSIRPSLLDNSGPSFFKETPAETFVIWYWLSCEVG